MDASQLSENVTKRVDQEAQLTPQQSMSLDVAGTQLVLLSSRLVWWPQTRTLFMADSHFGKAAKFRSAGIPVPAGTTPNMLEILSSAIGGLEADRLVILGDFVHSTNTAAADYQDDLCDWRETHADLEIALVPGNHDRSSHRFFERLKINVTQEQLVMPPFLLCHDPAIRSASKLFCLAGHLHPGLRHAALGQRALPCFWQTETVLVLPAFGIFTGLAKVHARPGDSFFALHENQIHKIAL